jgi:hypothetical protein
MALRDAQSALRRFAAERDFGAEMEMAFESRKKFFRTPLTAPVAPDKVASYKLLTCQTSGQ